MKGTLPRIILIEPQLGENIGAAARAMLNCGLTELTLVNPRDGWPNEAAIRNAAGAFDTITPIIVKTYEEALEGLQTIYATTARRRDMAKPVLSPAQSMQKTNGKTGILFGRERTGLENHHVAPCHGIIEIPCNPNFSSYNLAQAVLLISYEWSTIEPAEPPEHIPAPHEQTHELYTRLESALEERGFFRSPNLKPTMINNIKAFLARANMSHQETRTFHGMISALIGNKTKP